MANSTSIGRASEGKVALPPYFPVDRNEAYIETGTPDLPASAVSKYLGLAWRLHRREVLPVLERIIALPASTRAATGGRRHPGADERAGDGGAGGRRWRCKTSDPVHRRELFALLGAPAGRGLELGS